MLGLVRRVTALLLEAVTISLLALLTAVVVAAVVMRKFGQSLIWYDEVALVLLAWLSYYGAALAALGRAHLAFTGLVARLGPGPRALVFLFGEVAVVGFFALAAWYGWLVLDVLAGEALISLPWLSYPMVHSVIPIGAALFLLAQLLSLPEAWRSLRSGDSP